MHTAATRQGIALHQPALQAQADQLAGYLRTLGSDQIQKAMHVSPKLAGDTQLLLQQWTNEPARQTAAIDSFIGDVYSGLRAADLSPGDREYADRTLWILSGLYGFLRPLDGVFAYRLEMGYRFDEPGYASMYRYWGSLIADHLPASGPIINVSSVEYTKVITPFVDANRIIAPVFLTVSQKTGLPTFVAVHAKIARGAFARWLITSRLTDMVRLREFDDLGYSFDATASTERAPVFVCQVFGGLGLSIRLV